MPFFSFIVILFSFSSSSAQYDCQFVDPCINLACFNGFEAYATGSNASIHDDLGGAWRFSGYMQNSPMICQGPDNNIYLLLDTDINDNRPGLCFPLKEPIEPGCTVHIEFLGARNHNGHETLGTVLFSGSENYPCLLADTDVNVVCSLLTNCNTLPYDPVCIGQQNLNLLAQATPSCGINKSQMTLYTVDFTNNTNKTLNFITIYNEEHNYTNWVAIDDLVITRDCGSDADFTWDVNNCTVEFTSVNQSAGVEHLWNFNQGIGSTSKSINPSYTFPGSGTYQVSHTVYTDCGQSTVTYNITVECNPARMCGCEDETYNIGDENDPLADVKYSKTGLPLTLTYIPCLSFVGRRLIIDEPLVEWKAVKASMSPGSEIVIEPGKEFNYTLGTIKGCEKMWRGITVQQEGTFRSGALKVKDAHRGLWAEYGSAIDTKQMTFENCYIGMNIDGNVLQYGSGVIYCDFTTPGPFLPTYVGQPVSMVARTHAGIQLNSADMFTIGIQGFSGAENLFQSLENGILSYGSMFASDYNSFSDGTYGDMYGIWNSFNSESEVRDNSFLEMYTGIINSQSNIEVLSNLFTTGFSGITGQGYQSTTMLINEENQFESLQYGIWLSGVSAANALEIDDNDFDECHHGILLANTSTTGTNPSGKVDNNSFTDSYIGIELNSSTNWLVNNNIVGFEVGGIQLGNSPNNQIRNNQTTGVSLAQGTAMIISNSLSNFLCCNTLDNSNQGLLITGVSTMVDGIARTQFFAHDDALKYKNVATVYPRSGPQNLTGNKWNTSSTTHDAYFDGTPTDAQVSEYTVEILPSGLVSPSQWFFVNGVEDQSCSEINQEPENCGETTWSLYRMTAYDEDVVENRLVEGNYHEAVVWIEKMRVFNKLLLNPHFITDIYEQFYNEYVDTDLGKVCLFKKSLIDAESISLIDNDNLDQLHHMFGQIQLLNSQLLTVPDEEISGSTYQQEKTRIFTESQPLLLQYRTELNESRSQQLQQFNQLLDEFEQFDPQTVYAETFKQVQMIHLHYLISTDINSSDLDRLTIIGNSCPFELGFAVFFARNLMDGYQGSLTTWPSLDECCTDGNPPVRLAKEEIQELSMELFPNPAAEYLYVKLSESVPFKYNLRNSSNNLIRTMEEGSVKITLAGLPAGAYVLEAFVQDQVLVSKFVKI